MIKSDDMFEGEYKLRWKLQQLDLGFKIETTVDICLEI